MPAPNHSVEEIAVILARGDDATRNRTYDEVVRARGHTIADARFRDASAIVDNDVSSHRQRVALQHHIEQAMVHTGQALAAVRALADPEGEAMDVAYVEEERGADITDFLNYARRALNAAHAIDRT